MLYLRARACCCFCCWDPLVRPSGRLFTKIIGLTYRRSSIELTNLNGPASPTNHIQEEEGSPLLNALELAWWLFIAFTATNSHRPGSYRPVP